MSEHVQTVEDVKARVDEIRQCADDDESAHGKEDDLWFEVLTLCAAGDPAAREMAQQAILTRGIEFARWCA